ncbi:MAG: DUF1189 family protein [Elusimicrobiota bacterium]
MILDPVNSIVNFPFYREVPKKSGGAIFGYIAYLGLLYSLTVLLALFIHMRPRIAETVDWLKTSVPKMTLADGKLTSEARGPVSLVHPAAEEIKIIIDTDRKTAVTPAEMTRRKAVAYLTQNTIYVLSGTKMEAYDLTKAENKEPVVIDGKFYTMIGKVMNVALYPIAFITTFFVFLVWKFAAALIYWVLALIINALSSGGQQPGTLFKISVYAQTPVVALQMLTMVLMKPIPLFRILAFILVGVYLWQAIRQQQAPPAASSAV